MASEDSHSLNTAKTSASPYRRLPPRFIGDLNMRTSSMPDGDKCRPDWTSVVISPEDREVTLLRTAQWEPVEEGKHPFDKFRWTGHLVIVNSIPAIPHRSHVEGGVQELWELTPNLRDIERQRDTPRQTSTTLSTDWDVEASFSIDESRDPVT